MRHIWNLSGLLIGNGWVSPREQSLAYLEYSYKHDVIKRDSDIAKELEAKQAICIGALNSAGTAPQVDYKECETILTSILRLSSVNGRCVNMYDVTLDDTYPSCGMNWPPDLKDVTPYLRRQDVVEALHVNSDKKTGWTECTGAVSSEFRVKKSVPSIDILPDLLKEVPIILFSGENDLICNHLGTEEFIHNMEWNGGKGFELSPDTWAPRRDWTFEGELAGIYQHARNLTYVLFYNSSHMVPFDYPRRTRDMLDRFIGVDIASIGGSPADSRLDGEKGLETSVGGHPNSTVAEQNEQDKLDKARWAAYYKSGEIALVLVALAASLFGYYVWRDRRTRAGYQGLFGGAMQGEREPAFMRQGGGINGRDVEAADFDESELDNLHSDTPRSDALGRERYSLGGMSDDEDGDFGSGAELKQKQEGRINGHGNGHVGTE